MKKLTLILAIMMIFSLKTYGQENTDSTTSNSESTESKTEETAVPGTDENASSGKEKNLEFRGSIRQLVKMFSESPTEIDLLETRLKLELLSKVGDHVGFHVLNYITYQYPSIPQHGYNKYLPIVYNKGMGFNLQEAYIDLYSTYVDFRLGQQTIAWGRADEINPTDVLNPQDMTNITEDKSIRRKGLPMAKMDIKLSDVTLTAVWKPFFEYTQLPAYDSRWAFFEMPGITNVPDAKYHDMKLGSTEWALKLSATVSSVDFSFSYFDGYENIFTPSLAVDGNTLVKWRFNPLNLYPFKFSAHRTRMFGTDLATSFEGVGFWVEAAFFWPYDYKKTITNVKDPYVQYVVGFDYEFNYKIKLNVQYFQDINVYNYNDSTISRLGMSLPVKMALIVKLEKKFGDAEQYKAELFAMVDLKKYGFMITPKFHVSPVDALNIEIGYNIFWGKEQSFYSRFLYNHEPYLKCTYSF